jgi:methyl-accepting chemotaxis protein
VQNVGDAARDKARDVTDKAKDTASAIADKAKDVASNVGSTAKDVASNLGNKADSAVTSVGAGMHSVADTIRDKGPSGGFAGQATSAVASTLDSGGRYLEEHGLSGMADDLTNLIRRNPLPALLVGVGLGYLLARMTSRS